MTRPRKRRPTFSGPQSLSKGRSQSIYDEPESSSSQEGLMSGALNQRRANKYTPSSFVERWIRRSSHSHIGNPLFNSSDRNATTDPLLGEHDDDNDFGVGIPIDDLSRRNSTSPSDSLSLKSKPSTRRSSMDSSIDDVCMPIDDEENDSGATQGVWPDTAVLDEYAKKELAEQATAEAAALVRESVNEAADAVKGGRLRPQRYVPWDKSNVLRAQSNMRFTYFRDDLPATIHSPTIAGLLNSNQSFADLFPQPTEESMSLTDSLVQGVAHGAAHGAAQGVQGALNAHNPSAGPVPVPGPSVPPMNNVNHNNSASRLSSLGPTSSNHGAASNSNQGAVGATHTHSTHSTHAESPAPSIDPGQKEMFPDIQPDPAVMSKLRPPSVNQTATETGNDDSGPWWLDINSPTEEEMRILSRAFGIHPLTTEDIVLHEKREKVELFHNYYFVCFTSFDVKAWESGGGVGKNGKDGMDDENNNGPGGGNEERRRRGSVGQRSHSSSKQQPRRRRKRVERLKPLAVFSIVFKTGIITVHYRPTPHTINVRRRIRLLRDYLNVSSDWISYALIDDITDGYGPLITAVDEDVQGIDDAIMNMHSHSDSDDDSDDEAFNKSVVSSKTGSSSTGYREWREKGNMLRWIGETRKRVMSLLSLLGSKADVIKGFSKRVGEQWSGAPRSEIAMYLSDIQDHLVTMTQSLNHYEKQLARSHSNYLAQINIDMTRTNNEMNDVLSKISVLGTIVLPMNIVTGLWGMNVLVPGQNDNDTLAWFYGIVTMMIIFGVSAYFLIVRFV